MKKLIQVKQQHLEQGHCGESESCPVALAFQDAGIKDVSVYEGLVLIDGTGYPMPNIAAEFISKWDDPVKEEPQILDWNRKMFSPFEFEFEYPGPVKSL